MTTRRRVSVRREAPHRRRERRVASQWRAFECCGDGILVAALDENVGVATIEHANPALCRMLGYRQEELADLDVSNVMPADRLRSELAVARSASGVGELFEERLVAKDGACVHGEIRLTVLDEGPSYHVLCVIRDIGERKHRDDALEETNAALRTSEEMLRRAQAISHVGSWELDVDADSLSWSDEVYRIFGVEPGAFDATYDAFLSAVHPDDREAVDAAYQSSLAEGSDDYEIEHRVVRAHTGEVRVVHEKCTHHRDDTGRVVRSVGMVHDITELVEATEEVRSLAQFPSENPSPVLRVSRDGQVLYANHPARAFLADMGWHEGALLPGRLGSAIRHAHLEGTSSEVEILCPDGRSFSFVLAYMARDECVNLYGQESTRRRRDAERLRLISQVASRLLQAGSPQDVLEDLCREVMTFLGCEVFINFLADEDAGRLHLNAYQGIDDEVGESIEWLDYGEAVCGCVARDRLPIVADHVQSADDTLTTTVRRYGVQAYACHPMVSQGRVIGTLSFGSQAKSVFDEDELALMRDVTNYMAVAMERVHFVEALERHAAASEAANAAKSQLLARVSHELRTPVTALAGMTELALREASSPSVRDMLKTSRESAGALMDLLDDFLDLSVVESGKLKLEESELDIHEVIGRSVRLLGLRAYQKGLELVCTVSPEVPRRLGGDPKRLRQVLTNLVSNAVKYTDAGYVAVEASLVERRDAAIVLELSVTDTGIGIAAEDEDAIFEPFVQVGTTSFRKLGGFGLGLAITRRLVELMGGTIWVEHPPEGGTTFRLTAQLTSLDAPGHEDEALVALKSHLMDLSALVIEDRPASQRCLTRLLSQWCETVDVVADVKAALAKLRETSTACAPPPLVLASAALAAANSSELAGELTADSTLAAGVVLLLSPVDQQASLTQFSDLGLARVWKPISERELLVAISTALRFPAPLSACSDSEEIVEMIAAERSLNVLVVEDTPANQKLVEHVLVNRGHCVETTSNGRQALERLMTQPFDVVLMDLEMPVMDGFETTAAIRQMEQREVARVPIVAMSAHVLSGVREQCLDAGMDDYIGKPLDADALIDAIESQAVRRPRGPRESGPPTTTAQPSERDEQTVVFDRDRALATCFGNAMMFHKMVRCFFDEDAADVEQLRVAAAEGDAKQLVDVAHRLKNTLVYLGARPAVEAARRLEKIGKSEELEQAEQAVEALAREVSLLHDALSALSS